MRYTIIISILILFMSGLAFAQEDTLILLGTNPQMGGYAVAAYNMYAFVAAYDSIKVANYSDPSNPYSIITYPGNLLTDIEIKDTLAYYVGDSLYIRDILNPLESQKIASCGNWNHSSFRVHLFDTLALVIHGTAPLISLLEIIDISDPTNPQILSTNYPSGDGAWGRMDVWKKNNYVFWVDYAIDIQTWKEAGQITVLDITDPTEPIAIVVDTCLPSVPAAIWIKDNYAYVALNDYYANYGGLMVLDISDPYNIDSIGSFAISEARVYNVFIKDNFAYVPAEWDGIYVLDITDPTDPTLVTYYDIPDSPNDFFVDEPYVLVAGHNSLFVFEADFLKAGDVNSDGIVNSSDVVYLIDYLFKNGPEPSDPNSADVNFDCQINSADVVYLIDYLFRGGPRPQYGCVS